MYTNTIGIDRGSIVEKGAIHNDVWYEKTIFNNKECANKDFTRDRKGNAWFHYGYEKSNSSSWLLASFNFEAKGTITYITHSQDEADFRKQLILLTLQMSLRRKFITRVSYIR